MTKNDAKIPRVSVILPTYNHAQFLPGALDSIFNQTYQDFELIVVNDGSKDNTKEVLSRYQVRRNFTAIHKRNEKLPRALNTGFQQARGDYLTWTSADNYMLPHMLETLVAALDQNPKIGLVYADWEVIDDDEKSLGVVTTLDYDHHLLMRLNYVNACFLYRRICQEVVGLYDPEYYLAEDWEYWWRISCQFQMLHVSEVLYQYRIHKDSLSTHIRTQYAGVSPAYEKLLSRFRNNRLAWYWSKVKLETLKFRQGGTALKIRPATEG